MQLPNYTGWEIVSYVQIFVFFIFLIEFIISIIFKLKKRNELKPMLPFFILFGLFLLLKVAGGILALVFMHQQNFQLSLFIPTYVFDTVSLGFITRSISSLIQHMFNQQGGLHNGRSPPIPNVEYKANDIENQSEEIHTNFAKKFWPFKLVTIVLIVAVILSIYGTSEASETNPPSSVGTFLRTSSILFLVGVILMIAILVFMLSIGDKFNIIAKLLISGLVILIVRCAYSIMTTFHGINFEEPSKYMILFGDYKYYTFMGLMIEGLAAICILIAYWHW